MVVEHEGGYTPFEADITELAEPGASVRITVVVNNELHVPVGPPGRDPGRARRHAQPALLPRLLQLRRPAPQRVAVRHPADAHRRHHGRHRRRRFDGRRAVPTSRSPAARRQCGSSSRDADGRGVAEATVRPANCGSPTPHLWGPGHGYLHELTVELSRRRQRRRPLLQPVGIRSVRVDGTRFLINGEPFYFRGFGMHEDHVARGKGHDDASMVHDFALLQWIGANSFRTSHYPYAEEVLDQADRLGIVVIDETAAVGQNLAWAAASTWAARARRSPTRRSTTSPGGPSPGDRELVARDKNHPSVVLWSIANEPESHTEESRRLLRAAVRRDPRGRPEPAGRLRQHDARAATTSAWSRRSPTW